MSEFSHRILIWYDQHARVLPWRGHPDSYAVWVSEIMLQQTRVETVRPYFERWMNQFPSVAALAAAPEQAVLSAWEGLGYYSRARNLHKAARLVVNAHNGQLPRDLAGLRQLPGIGRYTAAAIASIAFGMDVATLDGNLKRVFARVFNLAQPADSPAGENSLWTLAEAHLPPGRAGDYNQALMDLGATVCLPRKPLCQLCPLSDLCQARALGLQDERPVLKPKPVLPHHLKAAAVILLDETLLLNLRPASGLLGGLWEFPAAEVEQDSAEAMSAALQAAYQLKIFPLARLTEIRHTYTHFHLTEIPWRCDLLQLPENSPLQWIPIHDLAACPMGKVDRAIARRFSV